MLLGLIQYLYPRNERIILATHYKRIVDFLGFESVTDSQLKCAIDASTMKRLQSTNRFALGSSSEFFGTRGETEQAEELTFPPHLIKYFRDMGMFKTSRHELNYSERPEEALADDPKASEKSVFDSDYYYNGVEL